MRIYDVPLVPAVLGLVLGPLSELQFRRAMAISEGDITIFVTRPISAVLLLRRQCCCSAPTVTGSAEAGLRPDFEGDEQHS